MLCNVCEKPSFGGTFSGMPCCLACYKERHDEVLAALERFKNPPKQTVVCNHCGSDEITGDANAYWNIDTQQWEIGDVFEKGGYCGDCESHDARWSFKDIDGTVDPGGSPSDDSPEKPVPGEH